MELGKLILDQRQICFLIGHNDPVMELVGLVPQDDLYETWKTCERDCGRCGKALKPK